MNGDSDSTGAIAGNIMGAIVGYEAIEQKWKTNLELKKTILELADDLRDDCHMEFSCEATYFERRTNKFPTSNA